MRYDESDDETKSDAEYFGEDIFETMKEFVDEDGRHFYVLHFDDGSGFVFQKQPSDDSKSTAELVLRDNAKGSMRMIASGSDFEVDEGANTRQNLRTLLREESG